MDSLTNAVRTLDVDLDEPVKRTPSKTLRMDIMRMASIETQTRPSFDGHALSPDERDLILGVGPHDRKHLMYSSSLKKRSLEFNNE